MSSIIFRTVRPFGRIASSATRAAVAAPRYTSTRLYSSTMHDNDPNVLETEKRKNLEGKQHKTSAPHENAPGWNELLATVSEADVKADKVEGVTPEILAQKTIEQINARHHAEESTVGVEAEYERDEVVGPLKEAYTKVKEKVTTSTSGSS